MHVSLVFTCCTPLILSFFTTPPPARVVDPHADSVVMGITFGCVLLLLLITLFLTTNCYFIRKNDTVKKRVSMVSS